MAYATSNPPSLTSQRVGASGGAEFMYKDGDAATDVCGNNYITNAADLGIKAGDTVKHIDDTTGVTTELVAASPTTGTMAGALGSATEAIGETQIALQSAGTGTIIIGDIVYFGGDKTNLYEVTIGDTDVSNGGTFTITPSLVVATANGTTITIKDDVIVLASKLAGRNIISGQGATRLLLPEESGSTCLWDRAAGLIYTLPVAVIGYNYRFRTTVTLTSSTYSVITSTATAGDFFLGTVMVADDAVAAESDTYFANGTSHLGISSNKTTTGGLVGGWFDVECITTAIWEIKGHLQASGGATVVTPLTT